MTALIPTSTHRALPAIIAEAGPAAAFAWDEFFGGQLRNRHTKAAYRRAVVRFLAWLEPVRCGLAHVTPGLIGGYLDALPLSATSRKVELAALRRFFDLLVVRHVVVLNPAHSVRGDRIAAAEGSTPEIAAAQVGRLLDSVETDTLLGLRDRAVIGCLAFTAARAGASPGSPEAACGRTARTTGCGSTRRTASAATSPSDSTSNGSCWST